MKIKLMKYLHRMYERYTIEKAENYESSYTLSNVTIMQSVLMNTPCFPKKVSTEMPIFLSDIR